MQPECPGTFIIHLSNIKLEILAFPAALMGFSSPSFSGLVFGHDLWVEGGVPSSSLWAPA